MTLIQYQKRSDENHDVNVLGNMNPLFRSESFGYYYYYPEHNYNYNYTMMEKRQLFLRSYQFCRKKSLTERIKGSLVRVWRRLPSTRRLNRLVFSMFRIKCGFYYRRRWFSPLLNRHKYRKSDSSSSSCFC